ncbi:MAG: hypothetical protein U0T83_01745, partial [Bacteriovoracaceae bacterium]
GVDGNVTTASDYPTLAICGIVADDINDPVYYTLVEASKTYITLGYAYTPTSKASLVKRNGDIVSTGVVLSMKGSVRINGW